MVPDYFFICTIFIYIRIQRAIITPVEGWMFSSVIRAIGNGGVIAHNNDSLLIERSYLGNVCDMTGQSKRHISRTRDSASGNTTCEGT